MALPNSGQISMLDIYQEKTGFSSGRRDGDDSVFSLTGFSVDGTVVNPGASNNARDFIHDGDINEFRDGTPNSSTPYRMSEFYGYSQIQTHDVVVSFGSPAGKIGFRTGTITSGADVPFGTINLSGFSTTDNNNYVRMTWLNTDESGNSNSIPNRDWTSVELPDGTTFNRTALTESGLTQGLFPATNAQYSSWGSGTWTFTYS